MPWLSMSTQTKLRMDIIDVDIEFLVYECLARTKSGHDHLKIMLD